MKKHANRIAFVWFIVLYVFTIFHFIGGEMGANASRIETYPSASVDLDIPNYPFVFIPNQSESFNLNEGCNNIQTPVRKTHHFNSYASTLPNELMLECIYSTYISYSTQTVIQFQKTDIIFPFHYFS